MNPMEFWVVGFFVVVVVCVVFFSWVVFFFFGVRVGEEWVFFVWFGFFGCFFLSFHMPHIKIHN